MTRQAWRRHNYDFSRAGLVVLLRPGLQTSLRVFGRLFRRVVGNPSGRKGHSRVTKISMEWVAKLGGFGPQRMPQRPEAILEELVVWHDTITGERGLKFALGIMTHYIRTRGWLCLAKWCDMDMRE